MDLKLLLRLRFPHAADPAWWTDADAVACLVRVVQDAGLWFDFRWTGRAGQPRLRRLDAPDALASGWRAGGSYLLHGRRHGDPRSTQVRLTPNPGRLYLNLAIAPAEVEPRRATILDDLVRLAVALRASPMAGGVRFARACSVHSGVGYPPPRPIREPRGWQAGSLVDFLDRDGYVDAIGEDGAADELARVLAAPLPAGTVREEHGPLVVFRHVRALDDEDGVRQARRAQAAWITGLVPSPIIGFNNEHGDDYIVTATCARHPVVTAYDAMARAGYQAVFHAEGEDEPAELGELAAWARAGQLPDGTPLTRLTLVLSARSAAVALAPRARELGLRVAFVDASGAWWSPYLGPI